MFYIQNLFIFTISHRKYLVLNVTYRNISPICSKMQDFKELDLLKLLALELELELVFNIYP